MDSFSKEYCIRICKNISKIVKQKALTQTDVVNLCKKKGLKISQSTISNIISEHNNDMKISSILDLCRGLEVSIYEVLPDVYENEESTEDLHNSKEKKDIQRIYNGYSGDYHVYFFPTISNKNKLLYGELKIGDVTDRGICEASLKLHTDEAKKIRGKDEEILKLYRGEFVISVPMQSGYCLLKNEQSDEQCFFIFHHFFIFNNELKCRVAAAVTTSAGSNRRPTIHRIYLCRDKLSEKGEKFIRGQLRLNESEIIIAKKRYEKFLEDENIPIEFSKVFEKEAKLDTYYTVAESNLTNEEMEKHEFARIISLLRDYSVAPKYNKVSMKTDEFVFDNYENSTSES